MYNKGTLTARNIIDKFFPDIQDKGNYDCTTLKTHFDGISILLHREEDEDGGNPYSDLKVGLIETTMNNCGTTLEETADALRNNRMPPIPMMLSTGSIELEAFDGTTTGGRKLVAADADRPQNYVIKGNPRKLLKDPAFGFSFPDGTRLETNGKYMDNIPAVCDKVENLCGRVHVAQANSVMMMLSQSGLTYLRAGIPSLGLGSDEHSAVDYSLSKDATTGAVTIRYESPAELPVHFSWTATVDVDGNVTSTPLEVMDQATLAACKAGEGKAVAAMQDPKGTHHGQFALDKERAKPLIATMMRASGGDPDVISLLGDRFVCTSLLYNSQNQLRSPEVIQKRVAALRENVAELREATKGDKRMWKMGMAGLATLGGKLVPKGVLAELVKAVRSMDVGKLETLSTAADTPLKMHAAIAQFHQAVTLARKQSGLDGMVKNDPGGELGFGIKKLVGGLLAARFGENTLRAVKSALETPVAGRLMAIYMELEEVEIDRNLLRGYEADVARATGTDMASDVTTLLVGVNKALGVEESEPAVFRGNPQDLDGFEEICHDVINLTKNLHADLIETHRQKLEEQYAQNRAAANAP